MGAKEIAGTGSTVTVAHLRYLAKDLEKINSNISKHSETLGEETLSSEEKSLLDLAQQCKNVTIDLLQCLDTLIINNGNKKSAWSSIKAAFKTIWNKDRIDTLSGRLKEYRAQLTLSLLLVLNMHNNARRGGDNNVTGERSEIVEVVSVNCQSLRDTVEESRDAILSAILTSRDGISTGISARPMDMPSWTRNSDEFKRTVTTFSHCSRTLNQPSGGAPGFRQDLAEDCSQRIVDTLFFRGITHRGDTIPQSHKDTFEWVWAEELCRGSKHGLLEWLEGGSGCFWISGKAGSGKSSLMRYLQGDKRTLRALSNWSYGKPVLDGAPTTKPSLMNSLQGPGGQSTVKVLAGGSSTQLVVSSFYFWYAGSSLQKSHAGLLRSQLHDVLSASPSLAPVLFPDIYRSILARPAQDLADISFEELKLAFDRLIDSVPEYLKICFFVDGLDEYVGDHSELCALFARAIKSPRLKILVSSRPIPVCVANFADCPSIRLQDLTKHDIEKYVSDHLKANPLMRKMEAFEEGATDRLIQNIVSKACGVFLWVVLVTKKVIIGLQNYDLLSDMESEIEKLPSDLATLYDHMLGSMSEQGRILGSKYLQLLLRNMQISQNYPLTLLQLSFAEQEECTRVLEASYQALTTEEENWRCEATEGRLRSRCCGLVEVQGYINPELAMGGSSMRNRTIEFFHRTVVEFLCLDAIWDRMLSLTSNSSFEPDLTLITSAISELKSIPCEPPTSLDINGIPEVSWRLCRLVTYGEHVNHKTKWAFRTLYLDEIVEALQCHWYDSKLFKSPKEQHEAIKASADRGCKVLRLSYPESLIFSCGMTSTDFGIFDHLNRAFSMNDDDCCWYTTALLIHYTEELDSRIQVALAKRLLNPYTLPNTLTVVPTDTWLWKLRLQNVKAWDGTSRPLWSFWELIMLNAYSVSHPPEGKGAFEYKNILLIQSLVHLIIGALNRGARQMLFLRLDTRASLEDEENVQSLSAKSIIEALCQSIRLNTIDSSSSQSTVDAVNFQLDALESKLRYNCFGNTRSRGEISSEESEYVNEATEGFGFSSYDPDSLLFLDNDPNLPLDDWWEYDSESIESEQDVQQDAPGESSHSWSSTFQSNSPLLKRGEDLISSEDNVNSAEGSSNSESSRRPQKRVAVRTTGRP